MSGFTRPQIKKLVGKLDRAHVQSREIGGKKLDYIEGWFAVAEANAIFGFAGWDREMAQFERLFETRDQGETICAYLARVRVTVRTQDHPVIREGTGFGQGRARIRGEAHERALKAAETDATKRALATFGNRFGLALYDKEQNGVTSLKDAVPKSRALAQTQRTVSANPLQTGSDLVYAPGPKKWRPPLGNIFILYDGDGETLASALSGEGYCSGLRQLLEAYGRVEELEQLLRANRGMLDLLRTERPKLKSAMGEHFADILERLFAKKRSRLTATSEGTLPEVDGRAQPACPQPIDGLQSPNAGLPHSDQPATSVDTNSGGATNGRSITNGDATAKFTPQHEIPSDCKAGPDYMEKTDLPPPEQAIAPPAPGQASKPLQHRSRIGAGVPIDKSQLMIATTRRIRNKAHLLFVASQPCLICESSPCHAHHLTFAQPRGLSIKVSDEFSVPLCALHHNALHADGSEREFWRRHSIDPLVMARELWLATLNS